ncbi:DUF5723 family protein [uncultured Acetobacteroides sp.]|uniref:DUF5723 family protein n=1 Tax=uncultured Acetobacteroides sp. TaxID=1760811 RepID=UPI0029F4C572|nr:DUF5723 family protein [uncultured Acetobacteroides sp.]
MRRVILSIILLVATIAEVNAQDKTLYYMTRVPQSTFLNPSTNPEFSTYVGFPALSNIGISYNNSSFSLVDVLKKGSGLQKDSLVFDVNGLSKNLGKMNFIRLDNNIDLLSFGFRVNSFYGHFNISSKTSVGYNYPKGLVDLKNGNYDFETNRPRTIDLDDMGVNGFSYVELGLGLSKVVNEKLTVGARLKILNGLAAVKTSKFKANIVTSDDFSKSTINVDAEMFVSAPKLSFTRNAEGKIDDVSFDDEGTNGSKDYKFGSNLGLGVDFGGTYKFDDKFTFYGSVNDFGFIRWSQNGYKLVSKGAYDFNGADITPDENGDVDFDKAMEAIADTLKTKFKPTDENAKFTTMLKTKVYLGATYNALSWLNCGALLRGGFYGSYFDPALTLSANATPFRVLAFTLTYSIYNRSMNNFGAGLVVGGKPVQFYVVADNILSRMVNLKSDDGSSVMVPGYTRSFNLQFGINLQFGSRVKKGAQAAQSKN